MSDKNMSYTITDSAIVIYHDGRAYTVLQTDPLMDQTIEIKIDQTDFIRFISDYDGSKIRITKYRALQKKPTIIPSAKGRCIWCEKVGCLGECDESCDYCFHFIYDCQCRPCDVCNKKPFHCKCDEHKVSSSDQFYNDEDFCSDCDERLDTCECNEHEQEKCNKCGEASCFGGCYR
jgi:hypothetical protein